MQHLDIHFLKLPLNCTSVVAAHIAIVIAFFLILVLYSISEKKKNKLLGSKYESHLCWDKVVFLDRDGRREEQHTGGLPSYTVNRSPFANSGAGSTSGTYEQTNLGGRGHFYRGMHLNQKIPRQI